MLYQLSYASALKPSKNSRRGTRIARASKNSEHPGGQACGKPERTYLLDTPYPLNFLIFNKSRPDSLRSQDSRSLQPHLPLVYSMFRPTRRDATISIHFDCEPMKTR